MANPVFVDCPAGQFTKVATNVTSGQIHRKNIQPSDYLQTYKLTGEAAPANDIALGVIAFENSSTEEISASAGIDVYIWCVGAQGRVRVDV